MFRNIKLKTFFFWNYSNLNKLKLSSNQKQVTKTKTNLIFKLKLIKKLISYVESHNALIVVNDINVIFYLTSKYTYIVIFNKYRGFLYLKIFLVIELIFNTNTYNKSNITFHF